MPQPCTIVVNPASGRGRAKRLIPELQQAVEIERAAGLDIELVVSEHAEHPRQLARAAYERGRVVIAAGGDGLVHHLANVSVECHGVLGVIPIGSGNDVARHLGYDLKKPLDAFASLRHGVVQTFDAVCANDEILISVAASGFDSEANRWANTVTRLRGTSLYVAAVLRTLATYRPHRFRLTLDGDTQEIRAWMVAIANFPNYAGGMRIAPTADATDGVLDVTIVGPVSRLDFLRTFPKVFKGRHVEHPQVHQARARVVRLESLDPKVPIEVYGDGERIGPLPADIRVMPGALRLLCAPETRPAR